jgi:hypothetical protein
MDKRWAGAAIAQDAAACRAQAAAGLHVRRPRLLALALVFLHSSVFGRILQKMIADLPRTKSETESKGTQQDRAKGGAHS